MRKVTTEEFDELIYDDEETAAVIFHRERCGVCRKTMKLLEGIEKEHPEIVFAEADAEEEHELFSRFGVMGVPQVMLFSGGNLVKTFSGRHERMEYIRSIEASFESAAL